MDQSLLPSTQKVGPLTRFLVRIAGADTETLVQCPAKDWANVRAVAEIMLCTWLYQTCLFAIIAHRLFADPGHLRPEFILVAMFIATFILLIDSYMVMRSGWHLSGISELKRGGIDIGGGWLARFKVGFFFVFRILLSVGIAQLTAIFFGLIVFVDDVEARLHGNYLNANAPIIAAATERADAEIGHAREALTAETARVAAIATQLDALRQKQINPPSFDGDIRQADAEVATLLAEKTKADGDVQAAQLFAVNELAGIKAAPGNSGQAGEGVRYRAANDRVASAKAHAVEATTALEAARSHADTLRAQSKASNEATQRQTRDQASGLDANVAAERDRQAKLNGQLESLIQNRDSTIRTAVENAPNYVRGTSGFLAQVGALQQIGSSNPEMGIVILLIDFTSFGFELAGVLAKITSFVPTTYAAFLARDAYLQAVHIVDEMMSHMEGRDVAEGARSEIDAMPLPANDNEAEQPAPTTMASVESDDDTPPPTPPKRPRGRPRKTSVA